MIKKSLLSLLMVCFVFFAFSQSISKITINGAGYVDYFSIALGGNNEMYISKEGQIIKWGYDRFIGTMENYQDQLDPYMGRVENYTANDDEALQGKVKYIGGALITYFPSYENESLKGKIKSIGSLNLEYYLSYEDAAFKGLIKSIGQNSISWFASYENKEIRGKLKAVGSTSLSYYGSFEDKAFRGKIKSIGSNTITYYSSFEQFSGNVKSGAQVLNVNSIKFFTRNF